MNSIKSGWDLIKYSTTLFLRHPVMLMPLLFTWLLYAPTVLYFKYRFDWDPLTLQQTLLTVLGITFFFALLLAFSASMLLELIQQAESGRIRDALVAEGGNVTRASERLGVSRRGLQIKMKEYGLR